MSLPAGPVFPPFDATYRGRAKISLNNTLKSRFIRRADGTNSRQFAVNLLTIRSPRQRRFRKPMSVSTRARTRSTPGPTAASATSGGALS
jgi:hypothetical protein